MNTRKTHSDYENEAVNQTDESAEHPDFIHPEQLESEALGREFHDQQTDIIFDGSFINIDEPTPETPNEHPNQDQLDNDNQQLYGVESEIPILDSSQAELDFDSPPEAESLSDSTGEDDFFEDSIDVDEIDPSHQDLDELIPEGSKLEDYSINLAFKYGYRMDLSRRIIHSILEDFPHYQSYLAIFRLIEKGFSLEIIQEAAELKSTWQSSESKQSWLIRSKFAYGKGVPQITWETCARLCSIFGLENALNLILNHWKKEWLLLSKPEEYWDKQIKNSYWYFGSFVNYQTKLNFSEFPINFNDHLSDEEKELYQITKEKAILMLSDRLFSINDSDLILGEDGSLWQDMGFQKRRT